MFNITMKPRAYRIQEVVVMSGGYPTIKYRLQCQTRMGWNSLWRFDVKANAVKALNEWKETLDEVTELHG